MIYLESHSFILTVQIKEATTIALTSIEESSIEEEINLESLNSYVRTALDIGIPVANSYMKGIKIPLPISEELAKRFEKNEVSLQEGYILIEADPDLK